MEPLAEDMECHSRKSEGCALLKVTGDGQTVLSGLSKRFLDPMRDTFFCLWHNLSHTHTRKEV